MGLLDQAQSFAQGASNGVAGSLTGPVDGLAWLLRKAGVPVPQAPLGGSDWMRSVGLMQEPKERMAGLLGEGIGSALPTVIAGRAPQIAGGLLQMERNAMAPRTLDPQAGAVLWHGSPHKFDKFDSSKIGTGEGAQAYGHGLYLAEAPAVAKEYATKLSSAGLARNTLAQSGGDIDGAIAAASRSVDNYRALLANGGGGDPQRAKSMLNLAEKKLGDLHAMKGGTLDEAGSLYKVDLPDEHIAKMLDWDKPLSQQAPEVQKAISKYATANVPAEGLDMGGGRILANHNGQAKPDSFSPWVLKAGDSLFDISQKDMDRMLLADKGEAAYTRMTAALGAQGKASDALRQAGIPGIRYLDGGSRGAGAGSSNYVVFPGNEGLLKILERNGQGLPGN